MSRPVGLRGILLGGGYDSRWVAKGYYDHDCPITTVVIGDDKNAEVQLAQRVARALGSEIRVNSPLKDCQLNVEWIRELIRGPETVNYTHFHTPAKVLKQLGAICVSTGYGGDTLLGGNGYALLGDAYSNVNRFKLGLYRSLGLPLHFSAEFSTFGNDSINASIQSFYLKKLRQALPFFHKDWLDQSINSIFSRTIADIEAEVRRLSSSDPESPFQVIERFWREHQERYTAGIVTTLAASVAPVLPFMHPKFVEICSNLSPAQKVDNGIYQAIVRKYFGKLAAIPTGSTPLSASFPDLFLLLSRALRSVSDTRKINEQVETKGKSRSLRHGWPNFEQWFRQGPFLENAKDLINCQVYSKEFLDQKINRWINWEERLYSGQELLTIITISQLLS